MNKKFELHPERLATTDEFGKRVYLYPEDVTGPWRDRRTWWYWFLIFIYMVLPWIHIDGKQVILLNLPAREFHFFNFTLYGSDAPLLFFVFVGSLFFIATLTSLFGRVWCGWACPQTVFIDAIFSRIDRLIEGRARARKQLDEAPWGPKKIFIKSVKWILYLIAALHISHSFLGYFVGTYELVDISLQSPFNHPLLFSLMAGLTVLTLFDFGWFREQFCIIACPYGRLQSVLLDSHSWVVGYDAKRGEPRRSPEVARESEGDCINCYHCVKVCPTGIDIRRGLQLECIHCTQCIDACDEIMDKIGKPKGLIRYTTENLLNNLPQKMIRPRNLLYAAIMVGMLIALMFNIKSTQELKLQILRSTTPFSEVTLNSKTMILNHFRFIAIAHSPDELNFSLPEDLKEQVEVTFSRHPMPLNNGSNNFQLFIKFAPQLLKHGQGKIILYIDSKNLNKSYPLEVPLVGPLN